MQTDDRMTPAAEAHDDRGLRTGTVFRKSRGLYDVRENGREVRCSISNRLRKILLYPTADPNSAPHQRVVATKDIHSVDPIAIGDTVSFVPSEDGGGMIREVCPRRNKLARRAAGSAKRRSGAAPLNQVVVANVDQVVPVFAAARPKPKWHMMDRYLVAAEASGIPAMICITKMDLADRPSLAADIAVYERIGYLVMLTSSVSGEGVSEFRTAISGKVSVFVGKSGTGKTSLLNAVQPELGLRVREVSDVTGKGKHATSHLEMFPLDGGGGVVDTPGMREFMLLDADSDPAIYFPEMRPYVGTCKFGADCSHSHEPGCAIKEAVQEGLIDEARYQSLLKL